MMPWINDIDDTVSQLEKWEKLIEAMETSTPTSQEINLLHNWYWDTLTDTDPQVQSQRVEVITFLEQYQNKRTE